ncbi:hypothetical protein Cgig2_011883 [Carnegiea gigantea]|uniref:Uncharacterized protein n=1 Tax=Carnegiea gigantea TaxID=171969 RepID=A0A9Q1K977_9CARY|nr:hypothetical protein Cgig2_011883 [Carnegiea gigantea]
MVQAIFYAMVLNDTAELGLSRRIDMNGMMSALRRLFFVFITVFNLFLQLLRCLQFRKPKKIPYAVLIFEPSTPSWSSCEYSSTPSILSIEKEVSYPWEITIADFMNDVPPRRMAKTKSTPRVRTPDGLLAEGTLEGNLHSAPSPQRLGAEVLPTISSSSLVGTSASSSSDRASASSSSEGSFTSSSSDEESTSSSTQAAPGAPEKVVLKKRGRTSTEPVLEVVAEGLVFPGAFSRSDPLDGLGTHFLNPKVVSSLKRTALEMKYLLPAGYSFVIPEADATVNVPPPKCIVVCQPSLNYGARFPLHSMILELLKTFELAPA